MCIHHSDLFLVGFSHLLSFKAIFLAHNAITICPKLRQSGQNPATKWDRQPWYNSLPLSRPHSRLTETFLQSGASREVLISKPNKPQSAQKQVRSSTFHVNTTLCVSPLRPVWRYMLTEKRGHKSHSAWYVAKPLMIKKTTLKMSWANQW